MKHLYVFCLSALLLSGSTVFSATQGVVQVANSSFEEPATSSFNTTVTDWFVEHSDIYREAVQSKNSSNVPPTDYGVNWLVMTAAGGVYQAIDTFSADWGYTFSGLLVGDRAGRNYGPIRIELWVGDGTGANGTAVSSFATLRDSISFDMVESDVPSAKAISDFTLYTGNLDTEGETVWLRVASTSNQNGSTDSQSYCDNINITAGYNPRTWGGFSVDGSGHVKAGDHLKWFFVNADPWIWSYSLEKWFYFPDPGAVWSGAWSFMPKLKEVVSAPAFSPAAGHYDTGVTVEISSATPGATIRYTTDGSEPSKSNGIIYTGSIAVNEIIEIKAIAYKDDFADSDVVRADYAFGRATLVPPQSVVDAGNASPNIGYRIDGSAYTTDTTSGGWQITHALAVAAGNSSAEAKMLNQIQYSLQGANCICANGGYPAQHERHITGAYTILKDTPFWDNTLSEAERHKITLLMKATLVSSAYTTADATYVGNITTLDGDTNLNRGWNPNFREGMFGGMIHGSVFFGGVAAVEDILDNYNHAAFLTELQAAGLTNTYNIFNWAADHPGSNAPTGAQIEANIRNYRYNTEKLKSPMGQLYTLTTHTYNGTVSCGLNGGAGIIVNDRGVEIVTGTIAKGCENLPNKGALGMLLEFASGDAQGPRSSILYAYEGFRPNLTNHVVVLSGGYWKSGSQADTIVARLNVGITDLDYKLENGYRNYAKGNGSTAVFDYNISTQWSYTFNTTLPLWFDVVKPYHGL